MFSGTALFKNDNSENITNYCPISLLSCFSKVLKHIVYNRFYKYLCEEELVYPKQFGFQKVQSTDYATSSRNCSNLVHSNQNISTQKNFSTQNKVSYTYPKNWLFSNEKISYNYLKKSFLNKEISTQKHFSNQRKKFSCLP